MSNTLKHPHPEVQFSHVGDDTITALTQLAEIFKTKVARTYSFAYQGSRKQNATYFNLSHEA
jgi:hypothetical protein